MNAEKIRITVLVENTARGVGVLGEHGLSVWVEAGGRRVLFDTGQGMALRNNAERLGVDVSTADAIVLSHGHFDHVGGLEWALSQAPDAPLHMHPRATEAKFSASRPGKPHRVSIPWFEQGGFEGGSRKIVKSAESHEVVPGVWATGEVPRTNDFEDVGGPFFLDEAASVPDPLLDDQSLFLPTPAGLVVIFGCAHAGVVNILEHIEKQIGGRMPVRLLLGGLHLLQASERRMNETIAALRERAPEKMVFCHCTGAEAVCRLHREFPGVGRFGHAGMTIEL